VHETPQQRTTWAPHGIDAYYVGPSLENYRCYKFFVPKTNTTRDATTVNWFPTNIKYPQVTTETFLRQTAEDLSHLLTQRNNPSTTLTFGSPIMNAYVQIASSTRYCTTTTSSERTEGDQREIINSTRYRARTEGAYRYRRHAKRT